MSALRELFASFVVDFDKEGALPKGDAQVSGLAHHLLDMGKTFAAAFAVHKVIEFTHHIIEQADALRDQTIKLRVSAEWLEGWQHAAGLAGSSAESFTAAFTKFNRNVAEAQENAKGPAAQAFNELGLKWDELKGKSPSELLDSVVAGLQNVQEPAKRTAAVMALFGKSGAELLPLFSEGPEAIAKMRHEVEELGAGFSQEFLDNADEFNDNVARLKLGIHGLAIQAIGPLLPYLVEFARDSVAVIKQVVGWVKHTAILKTMLIALTAKGVLGLVRSVPLLIARMGGLRAALMTVGKFALRTLLPLLLLEDVIVFLGGGKSAIGRNLDRIFGKGTQQQVRAFIGELTKFFGLFTTKPEDVRAAFADLPQDMRKSMGGFGAFLGAWGQAIVDEALFAANLTTGGWENAGIKITALWGGIAKTAEIAWTEVKFAGLTAAAAISDQWDNVLDNILFRVGQVQKAFGSLLSYLPGYEELGKEIAAGGAARQQRAGEKKPSAVEDVGRQWDEARLKLVGDFEEIKARLTAPAPGAPGAPGPAGAPALVNTKVSAPVTNVKHQTQTTNNNVKLEAKVSNSFVIPEGTSDEQQRAIASSATTGTKKGVDTKQLRAALVPTVGG